MNKCVVIQFSGCDCAGKSSQIRMLVDNLQKQPSSAVSGSKRKNGLSVKILWSRFGYTPGFVILKSFLYFFRSGKKKSCELKRENAEKQRNRFRLLWGALSIIDLCFFYVVSIRFYKLFYDFVILDRYVEDALLDAEIILGWRLNSSFVGAVITTMALRPDKKFLLVVEPEVTVDRSSLKREPFPDSFTTTCHRYAFYCSLISSEFLVLEGTKDIKYLAEVVADEVSQLH